MKISADTELLGTGLLDSFDFLDLIMHIESKTGRKINLAVADPSEFSVVRGALQSGIGRSRTGIGTTPIRSGKYLASSCRSIRIVNFGHLFLGVSLIW